MNTVIKGARISPNGKYRYSLWRYWDVQKPVVVWIMLNPSTADADIDDPTIRKCSKFARTWGYGGIIVVNLFVLRATDPRILKTLSPEELTDGHNADFFLESTIVDHASRGALIVAAWGQNGKLFDRARGVLDKLDKLQIAVHALKLAKDGVTPFHPLYVRDDCKPLQLWRCYREPDLSDCSSCSSARPNFNAGYHSGAKRLEGPTERYICVNCQREWEP